MTGILQQPNNFLDMLTGDVFFHRFFFFFFFIRKSKAATSYRRSCKFCKTPHYVVRKAAGSGGRGHRSRVPCKTKITKRLQIKDERGAQCIMGEPQPGTWGAMLKDSMQRLGDQLLTDSAMSAKSAFCSIFFSFLNDIFKHHCSSLGLSHV